MTTADRVVQLETAIRRHRDARGDDRCWLDDTELYETLGEPLEPGAGELPPRAAFLENCERYWECRRSRLTEEVKGPQGRWVSRAELERMTAMRYALINLTHHAERFETEPQGVGLDAVERRMATARKEASRVLNDESGAEALQLALAADRIEDGARELLHSLGEYVRQAMHASPEWRSGIDAIQDALALRARLRGTMLPPKETAVLNGDNDVPTIVVLISGGTLSSAAQERINAYVKGQVDRGRGFETTFMLEGCTIEVKHVRPTAPRWAQIVLRQHAEGRIHHRNERHALHAGMPTCPTTTMHPIGLMEDWNKELRLARRDPECEVCRALDVTASSLGAES